MFENTRTKFFKNIISKKEILLVSANQGLLLFGGILFNKLLSLYLNKSDAGYYFYVFSLASIGLLIFTAPFTQTFIRNVNSESRIDISDYIKFLLFPMLFFAMMAFFVISEIKTLVFTLSLFVAFSIRDVLLGYLNQIKKRQEILTLNFLGLLSKVMILCLFFYFLMYGTEVAIISQFVSVVVMFIVYITFYTVHNSFSFSRLLSFNFKFVDKTFFALALPIVVTSIASWSNNMGLRFIVESQLGVDAVADFSFIKGLASVGPVGLQGIVTMYFLPLLYSKQVSFKSALFKVTKLMLLVGVIGVVAIHFLSDSLIVLFLDVKYLNVNHLLLPFFISHIFIVISAFLGIYFFLIKKTYLLILPSIINASILIVLAWDFAGKDSIDGVSDAFLIASFFSVLINGILVYIYKCKYGKIAI